MAKDKAFAKGKKKSTPKTAVQTQPKTPAKEEGPQTDAGAPGLMTTTKPEMDTAVRARTMKDVQQSVGNSRISRMAGTAVQTKLTVGAPNDIYEQEAEKTANSVMRMTNDEGQNTQLEEKGVQTKSVSTNVQRMESNTASPEIEEQINRTKGNGNPLPTNIRASMEDKMNADFDNVNIHTDSQAVQMNQSLGSEAFTHGNDIYFNRGKYNPDTSSGKHLLAHELTHVQQQNRSGSQVSKSIQRRLFVSGAVEATVREFLTLIGNAAGYILNWSFRRPRVRIRGNTAAGPTSESGRRNLRTVVNNPRQHAEMHIGTNQPRVSIGAFPGAGSTIQNIDMDDIRNLNASLPNQGTGKAFHEMMENYHSHGTGAPGFGPSHQVGIEAESDVLEESGIAGRRVRLGGGPAVVIPAPPGQPTGPNIQYTRSRQVFTHYFLEIIRRVTTGSPTGPGADFEIVSARRIPKVQVSQRTVDRFRSGSVAVPPGGNAALNATLADLNANANSTLELEGFSDSRGSRRGNRRTSRRRAESVRAFFVANGINANRIAIVGRGETNFAATNNTAAGRAQNRRVVMTVHRP